MTKITSNLPFQKRNYWKKVRRKLCYESNCVLRRSGAENIEEENSETQFCRELNVRWHVEKSDLFMGLAQAFTEQSCNLYTALNKRPYRSCISWLQGSFSRLLSRLLRAAQQPHEMCDSPPAL